MFNAEISNDDGQMFVARILPHSGLCVDGQIFFKVIAHRIGMLVNFGTAWGKGKDWGGFNLFVDNPIWR